MIAPIFITEGAKVGGGVIGKLLNQHPEDAGRLQDNANAYQAALNGQPFEGMNAVQWMGIRGNVLPSVGTMGHWATKTATDDARSKYVALTSGTAGVVQTQPGPAMGGGGIGAWVASIFGDTAARAGAAAGTAGANQAAAKLQGTVVVMGVLLVGVAVVLFVELGRRRR